MRIWKFFHILSMFVSLTLMFGGSIYFDYLRRSRDFASLRRLGPFIKKTVAAGVVTFFVGVGFGFVYAWRVGFSLTSGWLVAAYVLVGVVIVLGAGFESPIEDRVIKAVLAADTGEPAPEHMALFKSNAYTRLLAVSVASYVALIYVMVVKPFS